MSIVDHPAHYGGADNPYEAVKVTEAWRISRYLTDSDGAPQIEPDFDKWLNWMGTDARIVKRIEINGIVVSTIFLGFDHNLFSAGAPILWETMIFGGKHDQHQWRYSSLSDAKAGHATAEALTKGAKR